MDLDDARAVIATQHPAVLATLRRDGTPQMSPVLATVDGQGRVVVSSRETAFKVRSLRRNPRVWLCVLPDGFYGRWIPGQRFGANRGPARGDGRTGGLLPADLR
jgi:PPOX class probable F420-dependent enzyme